MIWIEEANSEEALNIAASIRYSVYVEEQNKKYSSINYAERIFRDDLDADGFVLIAYDDGQAIGTLRGNWFDNEVAHVTWGSVFQLNAFQSIPRELMGMSSRLAILPEHRKNVAVKMLFEKLFDSAAKRSTELCFASCAPRLLNLFKRYGFREYLTPYEDGVVGQLHRLVMVLNDRLFFEECRSPFERYGQIPTRYTIEALDRLKYIKPSSLFF